MLPSCFVKKTCLFKVRSSRVVSSNCQMMSQHVGQIATGRSIRISIVIRRLRISTTHLALYIHYQQRSAAIFLSFISTKPIAHLNSHQNERRTHPAPGGPGTIPGAGKTTTISYPAAFVFDVAATNFYFVSSLTLLLGLSATTPEMQNSSHSRKSCSRRLTLSTNPWKR